MSRATGIGSWPGTDVREALRVVRDLLADSAFGLPYLPELPARGPGAELVGRTAGLLVDLPVDLQPSGWRLVDRPGQDLHRTQSLMRQDLDELAEAFDGYEGELKIALAGPWTLASSVWLARGERALTDPGAARDLLASLTEGLRQHIRAVAAAVPGASLVVQIDEPGLPAVLDGRLPTASGYGRVRAVPAPAVSDGLREVLSGAGEHPTVIHCCAPDVPLPLLQTTGVGAVSLDTSLLSPAGEESVGTCVEQGLGLWAGVVPTDPTSGASTATVAAQGLVAMWQRLGLERAGLDPVVLTPACGLAGVLPAQARRLQQVCLDAARELTEAAGS